MKNLISDGLIKKTNELKQYMHYQWPKNVGQMAVRFVNGNFRAQGWQGSSFQKWKANSRKGTILVKSGSLRRRTGFRIMGLALVQLYNDSPYAKVHNNGYKGTVSVRAHTRRLLGKKRVASGKFTNKGKERMKSVTVLLSTTKVNAFTRKVNIPRRQFMPVSGADSPVLNKAVERETLRALKSIFN
ncbi:MAG: hypothetical protein ABS68_00180 [Niastella sp. SCN 39-18]|nr:hypothetical protein [Sphingobacteriales bacterium]ODT55170.1 MAG: hypothetical protein ABS68_00180 [Niastella sp. SCN 39-18]OJW09118.1 MAG: hypothetical protein BGO53_00225 [Sphingobacteriales bacterium 39-19]